MLRTYATTYHCLLPSNASTATESFHLDAAAIRLLRSGICTVSVLSERNAQ